MNELNKRNFLLRMRNGNYFRLYSNKNSILITRSNNKENWTSPFYIEDMHPCFFACLDSNDNVNLLCEDIRGNVFYYRMQNDRLLKYKILKSTINLAYDRNFYIMHCDEQVIFFYTIMKEGTAMLVCQTFSKREISRPFPVTLVPAIQIPYWINRLDNKTILIMYPKVQGSFVQICAFKFSLDTLHTATKRKIITDEEGNCESPKFINLEDGKLALLYTLRKNNKNYLKFQISKDKSLNFDQPELITSTSNPLLKYNLEYSYDKLNVNWVEKGNIYFRKKSLQDADFSKAKLLKLRRGIGISYYIYSSNTDNEKDFIFSTEQPVSIDDKVYHAFYRENKSRQPQKEASTNTNTTGDYSKLINAITQLLSNQEESNRADKNSQNSKFPTENFLNVLANVFSNKDENNSDKINTNNQERCFKLGSIGSNRRFIAARE